MNNYSAKPDAALHYTVAGSTTVLIEEYLAYGLTETEVQNLDDANALFGTDIQIAIDRENARKSAVAAKDEDRAVVLEGITTIAAKLYANPAVTDKMLTQAGFAARPAFGGRTTPQQPTSLTANAFSDGRVKLAWNRNGTSRSSVFTIWAKGDTGDWTPVSSGTKTRVTLEGFTPGQFTTFKVTASVNNQTSAASNIAAIYDTGYTESLTIAA